MLLLGAGFPLGCGSKGSSNPPTAPPAVISSFSASPDTTILVGDTARLQAVFAGGKGVVQPGGIAIVSGTPVTVSPAATTVYTLEVTNDSGATVRATASVSVDSATATIGTPGGVVRAPSGPAIEIPFGALDQPTAITLSVTSLPPPSIAGVSGHVVRLEPEGLVFARPVRVSIPLPSGTADGAIYWSRPDTGGLFDSLGGTAAGGSVSVEVPYLSRAVVGAPTQFRTVLGVDEITWISATTRKSEPNPALGAFQVQVLRDDGVGGLVSIPATFGTGALAGIFSISGVPNGNYLLWDGNLRYVVTSTSSPDLGNTFPGRPVEERLPVPSSAPFGLTLSGLAPWQPGDQLEFFATEENDWDFGSERFVGLNTGDTSTPSFGMDLAQFDVQPTSTIVPADHAFIAQLEARATAAGVPFTVMSRVGQIPAFSAAPGATFVILSTAMAAMPPDHPLSVDFRGSQWEGVLNEGNPAQAPVCVGVGCSGFFGVLGQPGSALDGFYSANADVLLVQDPAGDGVIGPMGYGTPSSTTLAGNWGLIFDVRRFAGVFPPLLPGTTDYDLTLRSGLPSSVEWVTTPEVIQGIPVAPPVSMPLGITVNGLPFFDGATGIGTAPTIAWSAPRTGRPAFYQLTVRQLFAANGLTGARLALDVVTPDLSVTLPPSALLPGNSYVFTLYALAPTVPAGTLILGFTSSKRGAHVGLAGTSSAVFRP